MQKQCTQCSKTFQITDQDFEFYKKITVPEPSRCPQCRLIRRLLERNARVLYKRRCDFSGQEIISQFHKQTPFPVYDQKIWWSDAWDALSYGRNFDFNRLFFEQFKELVNTVPHMSVYVIGGTLENSDYTNCAGYLKNCYLVSEADYNEDCYYSNRLFMNNKDLVDCSDCYHNELCYECINCADCYQTFYAQECNSCLNSYFLYDCRDCKDCIGCINQRHQQYMIFNKQYTAQEYAKRKQEFHLDTIGGVEQLRSRCQTFFSTQIHKHLQMENNQASFGDHLYHSSNATYCFDCTEMENCKYCVKMLKAKECMDHTAWGFNAELTYECAACGDNIYDMKFCSTCTTQLSHCEYSYLCSASSHLFGCAGLKKQQYCILNKRYAPDEYERLVKRIKEHMRKTEEYGEFFPLDLSPFAYNETVAMDYFPLTKKEALQQGYRWYEEERTFSPATYQVPEVITDVRDDILQAVLVCRDCGKNYHLIKQELDFYKRLQIPIPTRCYTCRHLARVRRRNPIELWHRQCMCLPSRLPAGRQGQAGTQVDHGHKGRCATEFETNFLPDRKEIVYCELCYQKEIY